jgi:multidrug resistance protein
MALDLGSTTTSAFWIGTSYLLVSAVSQPAFASFSHVFGRRPVIIFALLLFDVGTIVCALSKNTTTILAGRTIQGLGSGGCLSIIEILITDIVPLHIRGEFFGLISLSWALGAALGPVIAGAVVEYSTWRWIFWILLPL